jgi:hypothetical protein
MWTRTRPGSLPLLALLLAGAAEGFCPAAACSRLGLARARLFPLRGGAQVLAAQLPSQPKKGGAPLRCIVTGGSSGGQSANAAGSACLPGAASSHCAKPPGGAQVSERPSAASLASAEQRFL